MLAGPRSRRHEFRRTLKIQDVSRRTGLSADVIRAWERRYGALAPRRDGNARRVYGAHDVRRLLLLRDAVASGHAISKIAALPESELLLLTDGESEDEPRLLARLLSSVRDHDGTALRDRLAQAHRRYTIEALCDDILMPLLHEVGEYWLADPSLIAKEHLTTASVNALLETGIAANAYAGGALVLFGTIAHERHDTGAKMAAAVAAQHGFRTLVLPPGSPPPEIADVARRLDARGVGVSVIYQAAEHTLRALEELLEVPLWVGGSAAPPGPWTRVGSMRDFARVLNEI